MFLPIVEGFRYLAVLWRLLLDVKSSLHSSNGSIGVRDGQISKYTVDSNWPMGVLRMHGGSMPSPLPPMRLR